MRLIFIGASLTFLGHNMAYPEARMEELMGKAFMPALPEPQRLNRMSVHPGVQVAPAGIAPVITLPVSSPDQSTSRLRNAITKLEETHDRLKVELEHFRSQLTSVQRPQSQAKPIDVQNWTDVFFSLACLGDGIGVVLLLSIIYRVLLEGNRRIPVANMNLLDGAHLQSSAAVRLIPSSSGLLTVGVVESEGMDGDGGEAMRKPTPTDASNRRGDVKMSMQSHRKSDAVMSSETPAGPESSMPWGGKTLAGTRWTVDLSVGVEPGTWMPPIWGRSGKRAVAKCDLVFEPDGRLKLLGTGPWDHLTVKFMADESGSVGGWSVERDRVTFYLEHEGLERHDVKLEPGRIYATAGAWGRLLGSKGNLCIRQRKFGWMPFLPSLFESSFLVGQFRTQAVSEGQT